VVDYGIFPERGVLWEDGKGKSLQAAIHGGLEKLLGMLKERHPDLSIFGVDGNYETDTVYNWAYKSGAKSCRVVPVRGVSSEKFSLPKMADVIRLGQECFVRKSQRGPALVFDSGYWQHKIQRGFAQEPHTRGSWMLYDAKDHSKISAHVASEKLNEIDTTKQRTIYKFAKAPGDRNDLLDALKICGTLSSTQGAGDYGITPKRKAKENPNARRNERRSQVIQL
jgi:hypothetical protein